MKTTQGTVYGKTIQLQEDLGLSEGQSVEVRVRVLPQAARWGEGLRRCAGALGPQWTDEDDRILAEIHRDRQRDTRRDVAE
jgi:hypothetical protein